MSIIAWNNKLGVEPFSQEKRANTRVQKGGWTPSYTAVPLRVVFGNGKTIFEGDVVWVDGVIKNQPHGQQVYSIDIGDEKSEVLIIPESFVLFVRGQHDVE